MRHLRRGTRQRTWTHRDPLCKALFAVFKGIQGFRLHRSCLLSKRLQQLVHIPGHDVLGLVNHARHALIENFGQLVGAVDRFLTFALKNGDLRRHHVSTRKQHV